MFIKKLQVIKNPTAQAALVSTKREELVNKIVKEQNPLKLQQLAKNIAHVSKQHNAAASLINEAEYALMRADDILTAAEIVAVQVMERGTQFFKRYGLRVSPRIPQMINKHETWTNVHAQLVCNGAGGKNFQLLCGAGKSELTSEWFIANHAPFAVNEEFLECIKILLRGAMRKQAEFVKAA